MLSISVVKESAEKIARGVAIRDDSKLVEDSLGEEYYIDVCKRSGIAHEFDYIFEHSEHYGLGRFTYFHHLLLCFL